jgi:hypothetical protein
MTYNIINTETEVVLATYETFKQAVTAVRMMGNRSHGIGIVFGGAMVTDLTRHQV